MSETHSHRMARITASVTDVSVPVSARLVAGVLRSAGDAVQDRGADVPVVTVRLLARLLAAFMEDAR